MSTVVKIDQQYEGHARQVLLTAIGANHDWNKTVIVVDEDVDINDFNDVWWAYLTRGRADTRAMVLPEVPGFYRDPHARLLGPARHRCNRAVRAQARVRAQAHPRRGRDRFARLFDWPSS